MQISPGLLGGLVLYRFDPWPKAAILLKLDGCNRVEVAKSLRSTGCGTDQKLRQGCEGYKYWVSSQEGLVVPCILSIRMFPYVIH